MAPELWRGGEVTARSDVFAYCTALAEAVGGADRLDPRLRSLVVAGVAEDTAARPALAAVVAACEGRRSRWPWLAVPVLAGAAAVVAVLVVRAPAPCVADGVATAGWDGDQRARWLPELRRTCDAEQAGEITATQARERVSCLERRAIEVEAIADLPERDRTEALVNVTPDVCDTLTAPPAARDRATIARLYARLVAAETIPVGSRERTDQLAALERDARDARERELEARAALWLGMRQIETEDLAGADAALARAYDVGVAVHSSWIPTWALVERSVAATTRRDGAAARTYGKLALELADKPGATAQTRAAVYYALGAAYVEHGDLAPALDLLRKAMQVIADDGHHNDRRELAIRFALISTLEQIGGHAAEALELARSTLELERKAIGEHHPDYGIALNVVAIALRFNDDVPDALDYRRRALAVMQELMPADSAVVLGQRANLAEDLYASGAFEEARAELAAVLDVKSTNDKWLSTRPGLVADLGALTFATGRTAEGMRLFAQGVDDVAAQRGPDHPEVLDLRLQQITLELELGQVAEAEHHADELERRHRARTDRPLDLPRLEGLVRARLALVHRHPDEAERLARHALSAFAELRGENTEREDTLRTLAESLNDQRRFDDAIAAVDQAVAIARSHHELDDRVAQLDLQRARALAGRGRTEEARALVKAAREALARFPGDVRARALAAELKP
jgi:tetratricopeptide (TPR) repeat protein